MDITIKTLNRQIDTLTNILSEMHEQLALGRGVYLLNSQEKMFYVTDAIEKYIGILFNEVETLSEENENIADNIMDLFGQLEELKND